jgi:hypothetical protein
MATSTSLRSKETNLLRFVHCDAARSMDGHPNARKQRLHPRLPVALRVPGLRQQLSLRREML